MVYVSQNLPITNFWIRNIKSVGHTHLRTVIRLLRKCCVFSSPVIFLMVFPMKKVGFRLDERPLVLLVGAFNVMSEKRKSISTQQGLSQRIRCGRHNLWLPQTLCLPFVRSLRSMETGSEPDPSWCWCYCGYGNAAMIRGWPPGSGLIHAH